MAYVNGEWQDDDPEDQNSPMAGLANTSTPNKGTSTGFGTNDDNGWGQDLNDFKSSFASYSQPTGRDWYSHEVSNIAQNFANSRGKGGDANYVGSLTGSAFPGKTFQQAPADLFPEGQDNGDSMFDGVGGFLALAGMLAGGYGLASGAFGAGATGGMSLAPEAFASAFVPNASVIPQGLSAVAGGFAPTASPFLSAAQFASGGAAAATAGNDIGFGLDEVINSTATDTASWANTGAGDTLSGIFGGDSFGSSGLYDMFNTGGIDFEGASSFMSNPGASATNLEQALQIPNVDVSSLPAMEAPPGVEAGSMEGYAADTVGPIDPATSQGLDAPIRELSRNAPLQDQARLGLKGLNQMTNSPYFQVPKTLYNLYSQNQKASQLEKMMSRFEKQSDVGGPFRDMMMRSMTDPNFFKSMPEFNANMDSFNQQYGANAAAKGGRSQLGGAAHNIAVNREGGRLADIYRSRIGPMAAMQPSMSGMAAMAPELAKAQGNQFNSLFDPQLWNSLKDFF